MAGASQLSCTERAYAERLVDVADRVALMVADDQLDRVGVVGVDPEREALRLRERRDVGLRQRVEVLRELRRFRERVVVDHAADDMAVEKRIEGGMIEVRFATCRDAGAQQNDPGRAQASAQNLKSRPAAPAYRRACPPLAATLARVAT